jgi:hypothetical protein
MLAEEIEAGFEAVNRHQEPIFSENGFLLTRESQLILITHHNRFFGTDFLAESTENTPEHVDLEPDWITFLFILSLRSLKLNRESRTNASAQPARNATLDSILLNEDRSPAERVGRLPLLFGILASKFRLEHLPEGNRQTLQDRWKECPLP